MMDSPCNVVHHLPADNFQPFFRELSFVKQLVQPINSFVVLFNFKLYKERKRISTFAWFGLISFVLMRKS